ncbi:MAG: ABC transporter permease [Sandaracinus sp.]|nr:ABC transporter permease [Sandaracinus sp.]
MSWLVALFDWRSVAVFRRNLEVYLRNWRTAFFPPAMEPVVYFLALGLGLKGFVGTLDYDGIPLDYATYVAPGLLAYAAFTTPFYESLYSAYVRMFYQKTWDGILATQVELEHLVWGEILWAAFRGLLNGTIIALVLTGFTLGGLVDLKLGLLPIVPLLGFVAGFAFSAFALVFTAIVPGIDHMNYPVFLIGVPLSLASNTYFPVSSETPWVQALIELNPVYQLAESSRALLVGGDAWPHVGKLFATSLFFLLVMGFAAMKLTRRRVLT